MTDVARMRKRAFFPRRHPRQSRFVGFSLVELLVVVAIVGTLVGMLLPAVQAARESARIAACGNKLRQLGIAISSHEGATRRFPPSCVWSGTSTTNASSNAVWSAQGRLLPYLEECAIGADIQRQLSMPYSQATLSTGELISGLRIPALLCPSEPHVQHRTKADGTPENAPLNYAVNLGTWLVFSPATRSGGNGAFFPNSRLTAAAVSDGLSKTIAMAEVKTYTPYFRNAGLAEPSPPATPEAICDLGGEFKNDLPTAGTGHTEWVDGRSHQTGFTAAFPPQARVSCTRASGTYDIDWTNQQEAKSLTVPTAAAVTARSHHAGVIGYVMLDGSVHKATDAITPTAWQALATRAGGEANSP